MSNNASEQDLKYHLISKYRDLIARRYEEVIKNLSQNKLQISADVAHEIKDFFLENIYPEPARRRQLDAAFEELKKFTHNPSMIWGLLGSLPVAIFQFGMQFPVAIKAGITSLQAYTSAIGFEEALLQTAIDKGFKEPLSDEQFFECIKGIPRRSIDSFINEASVLFTVISNTELLSKTVNIMQDVISRMKKNPVLYTADQVAAIQLGLDLMEKGYELLEPFNEDTKKDIISFITENEMNFIKEIYSG
jgi:hypothetical protein